MAHRKSRERELAELITKSLQEIEGLPAKAQKMFVKVDRVYRRKSLDPTENQNDLYQWIRRQKFVPWELTLGMHWGSLGGLMARGLVLEVTRSVNGKATRGIVARD